MNLSKRQQQALLVFLATNHSTRDASEWVLSELDDIELTLRDELLDEELADEETTDAKEDESEDEDEDEETTEEVLKNCHYLEVSFDNFPLKERAFLLDAADVGTPVVVELSASDDDEDKDCLLLNVYQPAVNKKKRKQLICDEIVRLVTVDDFEFKLNCVKNTDEFYRLSLILDTGELVELAVKYESQLDVALGSDTPVGEAAIVTLV